MTEQLLDSVQPPIPDDSIREDPYGVPVTMLGTLRIQGDRAALFKALAKAQGEYKPISRSRKVKVKTRTGDEYTFDYAPLEEVISSTLPALNANGIGWICLRADGEPGVADLHTMLTHESGAFMHVVEKLSTMAVNQDGSEYPMKQQEFGSQLTYRRRYQYQCLAGCSPEYDDDGNKADGNEAVPAARRQEQRREPPAPKPRQEAAKPASQPPPKQLQEELADRGIANKPAEADDPLAKDDELMNTLLGEAFQQLTKAGMNGQQKVIFAREATGSHPNGWKVSDGRKFLAYMQEKFPE
jgi:hypothetical protein